MALAFGLIAATWAALAVNGGRQRALLAETGAREGLWQANLAHAQAARRTTAAGTRQEALAALAAASGYRPTLALRNEAIAALCLDDAGILRSWPLDVGWKAPFVFDPTLATYLAEIAPGLLVRRSPADDREIGRFEIPHMNVIGLPVFSPDMRCLAVRYSDDVVRVWDASTARVLFALPGRPSSIPGSPQYPARLPVGAAAGILVTAITITIVIAGTPVGAMPITAGPVADDRV